MIARGPPSGGGADPGGTAGPGLRLWVLGLGPVRLRAWLNDDLAPIPCRDYNVVTMATAARIVRIGNSRGIRIPKALLEQAQLPEDVELQAEPGG